MKVGHRLQQLNQMITQPYDNIWDCCCDHGLLGMLLLQRQAASTIHFVDCIKSLTDKLQLKLEQHAKPEKIGVISRWTVSCQDIRTIDLNSKQSHLVIIAGVGGDQTLSMMHAILNKHPDQKIDFLLCPVHHLYKLRLAMIDLNLGLIDEKIIAENKRHYELIYVSTYLTESAKLISPIGSTMWDLNRAADRTYLTKTLKHYEKKSQNNAPFYRQALSAYQMLKTNLKHKQIL